MLKSLMELLFPHNKAEEQIPEVVWVNEKKKVNVKKSFATIRMKNGETLISKVFEGKVEVGSYQDDTDSYKWHSIIFGKQVLINFFTEVSRKDPHSFVQIQDDRLIRCADILDIINIVESDHEVEAELPVKKYMVRKQ